MLEPWWAEALVVIAGGSFSDETDQKRLREAVVSSISFPNKRRDNTTGKPHDIEVRLALSLFHQLKRKSVAGIVEIVSDMGLSRHINSPRELSEQMLLPLEFACRREGLSHDVRTQPSGVICIVTVHRSQLLRREGKLPCPRCTKWCQGAKGLWWHQQQNHNIEYSEATEVAASSTDVLAIIPYDPNGSNFLPDECYYTSRATPAAGATDPLDYVKAGDVLGLQRLVNNGYNPAHEIDTKGASPLMWAAGGGHLNIVRFLVEECACNPNQPQQGKRSFSGRTPLHWAARNGHIKVVEYLVHACNVDLEAATADGTTAFGWASWQGHVSIMKFLCDNGCQINSINSYGCNAVLWAAQGNSDLATIQWLQVKGCEMTRVNNNGHGVLHKAAQRGQLAVCEWFFDAWIEASTDAKSSLQLVAPDVDGWCPSDLAGMEGYDELARIIANREMHLIEKLSMNSLDLPSWLTGTREGISMRVSERELYTWERLGGVRRMRSRLSTSRTTC